MKMPEREGQEYAEAGAILKEAVTGRSIEEGELTYVVKCGGCGVLVNGGGQSRAKHDAFHNALADLFEALAAATPDLGTTEPKAKD